MKKLLIANYAGCEEDAELTTNSWTIGMYENEEDLLTAVNYEFESFIDEEVNNRFDLDNEDEIEAAEEFGNSFSVNIFEERTDEFMETSLVGELNYCSDFYKEELKIFVITIEK